MFVVIFYFHRTIWIASDCMQLIDLHSSSPRLAPSAPLPVALCFGFDMFDIIRAPSSKHHWSMSMSLDCQTVNLHLVRAHRRRPSTCQCRDMDTYFVRGSKWPCLAMSKFPKHVHRLQKRLWSQNPNLLLEKGGQEGDVSKVILINAFKKNYIIIDILIHYISYCSIILYHIVMYTLYVHKACKRQKVEVQSGVTNQ